MTENAVVMIKLSLFSIDLQSFTSNKIYQPNSASHVNKNKGMVDMGLVRCRPVGGLVEAKSIL